MAPVECRPIEANGAHLRSLVTVLWMPHELTDSKNGPHWLSSFFTRQDRQSRQATPKRELSTLEKDNVPVLPPCQDEGPFKLKCALWWTLFTPINRGLCEIYEGPLSGHVAAANCECGKRRARLEAEGELTSKGMSAGNTSAGSRARSAPHAVQLGDGRGCTDGRVNEPSGRTAGGQLVLSAAHCLNPKPKR
eukprot:SM000108S14252  [mRNA]  locus=s108:315905:317039:+ [translate_table: standard]